MLGFEDVIAWIVIGGVAGWLAGLVTPLLGVSIETKLGNVIAATVGAVLLLVLIGTAWR